MKSQTIMPMTNFTPEKTMPSINILNYLRAFARAYRPKNMNLHSEFATDSSIQHQVVVLNH